jgi:predicted component of type VI protein secretion system
LALTLPSFLLRYPYGPDRSVEGFDVEESEGLWGRGILVVGAAAALSFVDTGWPTHLAEYTIEDLPVQSGRGGQSPLSTLLPGSKQSELARAGFVVVSAKPDHDAVRIAHAPMVRQPETYDDPAATAEARAHASLPCRLFVARAAHRLLTLQNEIKVGIALETVQDEVASAMRSFLGIGAEPGEDEDPHVTVEHVTNVDLPEHELLAVRVRPPSTVLRQEVWLVMGLQVEREAPPEEEGVT